MVTALLFGSMIVFLAIGVPISFTLGAAVMATIFLAPDFTVSYPTANFWWLGIDVDYGHCFLCPGGQYYDQRWDFQLYRRIL